MYKKVMVSTAISSWYSVTKPFFVNNNGIKVNLRKELFPAIENLLNVIIGYLLKMQCYFIYLT